MRYVAGTLTAILVAFGGMLPVWAQGEKFPPIPDADEIIAHCEKISWNEYAEKGSGAFVSLAVNNKIDCIGEAIKENFRILVDEDATKDYPIDNIMEDLERSSAAFFVHIHADVKACIKLTCGNYAWAAAASRRVVVYEGLLRTVLQQRTDEEFPRD